MPLVENLTALARRASYVVSKNLEEQALQFTDWHLQYKQISSGRFKGASAITQISGVRIHVEALNTRILQKGGVPEGTIAVGIPLELEGPANICGAQSSKDTLHVFSCFSDFEFVSPEKHLVANIELETKALCSAENQRLAKQLQTSLSAPAILLQPEAATQLRNMIQQTSKISAELPVHDVALQASWQSQLERRVMFGLLESITTSSDATKEDLKLRKSWQVVKQVERLLEDPETCVTSIAELCVALQLSRRTIQYAFEYAIGMNPVSYLRAVRLNHVRADLLNGESVTFAATQWGFLHLSAFAQDYYKLFGELPSITQKKFK